MDAFFELPFWLSVTLAVVYCAIWVCFFLVIYAAHRRFHRYRRRRAMGFETASHVFDKSSVYKEDVVANSNSDLDSESDYEDDDD